MWLLWMTYITNSSLYSSWEKHFNNCRIPDCAMTSLGPELWWEMPVTDWQWPWPHVSIQGAFLLTHLLSKSQRDLNKQRAGQSPDIWSSTRESTRLFAGQPWKGLGNEKLERSTTGRDLGVLVQVEHELLCPGSQEGHACTGGHQAQQAREGIVLLWSDLGQPHLQC